MSYRAHNLEYFYTTVSAKSDESFELLDNLAELGVNFVALTLVPMGPDSTQLTLFPEDASMLQSVAKKAGLVIMGPHRAVLVQGNDQVGALSGIHRRLRDQNLEVFASTAITDGSGHFGCILYLRPEDAELAVKALTR